MKITWNNTPYQALPEKERNSSHLDLTIIKSLTKWKHCSSHKWLSFLKVQMSANKPLWQPWHVFSFCLFFGKRKATISTGRTKWQPYRCQVIEKFVLTSFGNLSSRSYSTDVAWVGGCCLWKPNAFWKCFQKNTTLSIMILSPPNLPISLKSSFGVNCYP